MPMRFDAQLKSLHLIQEGSSFKYQTFWLHVSRLFCQTWGMEPEQLVAVAQAVLDEQATL